MLYIVSWFCLGAKNAILKRYKHLKYIMVFVTPFLFELSLKKYMEIFRIWKQSRSLGSPEVEKVPIMSIAIPFHALTSSLLRTCGGLEGGQFPVSKESAIFLSFPRWLGGSNVLFPQLWGLLGVTLISVYLLQSPRSNLSSSAQAPPQNIRDKRESFLQCQLTASHCPQHPSHPSTDAPFSNCKIPLSGCYKQVHLSTEHMQLSGRWLLCLSLLMLPHPFSRQETAANPSL